VRLALDTNILAYAEGVNGAPMRKAALELVQKLPEGTTLLPVQTLGELFNLLVRKAKRPVPRQSVVRTKTERFLVANLGI
jgi:predicted nucleic acid-binding protein